MGSLARADRLAATLPLLTIYVWLCLIYSWEAWGNLTPWLFGDELEHTQLSRAIAVTGHAARRGEPHSADSLYMYVIAPAWWIHNTHVAYGVVKAINVLVMTAAIFPTYALARLLVSRRTALFAATAAVAVPAFAYSSLILEEPLAYTWSILCIWLAVRALATPSRTWIAAAVGCALIAPTVRGELVVVPAALVLALVAWWFIGERGRAWRAGWSRWDWAGFALLGLGAVILLNGIAASRSQEWLTVTQHYKGRMLANGMWAVGAFVIGIGVLPLLAGLAALFPGRWSARPRTERAFLCVAATTLLGYGWYTAVKAAYISTVFSTLVEERNIIYAAPLLIVATALFFERRRTHPVAIAAAAAIGFDVIVKTPYHMYEHFYADAPGLSILQSANRVLSLTPGEAQWVLLALLALCTVLVAAVAFLRVPRLGAVTAGAFAFLVAWSLAGQITGARSSHSFANQLLANLPRPLDWIDQATKGADVVYYGQRVNQESGGDPNGLWQLEFWNRSLQGMWTIDSTGVGPGPTVTPDVLKPSGEIRVIRKFDYAVADEGVDLVGDVIARKQHLAGGGASTWTLFRVHQPMRLRRNIEGILPDGWSAAPRDGPPVATSAYSQFSTPGNRSGYLLVTVSRAGGGKTLPANAQLRVGTLVIGEDTQPKLGETLFRQTVHADKDLDTQFVLDAPPAPFRAELNVWPTFRPVDLNPASGDVRQLGAQVRYQFRPKLPPPVIGKAPQADGIYADGWMGEKASYTEWFAPRGRRGEVTVDVKRPSGPGSARLELRIGRLGYTKVGNGLEFGIARVTEQRLVTLRRGERTITFRAPEPPFRLEVRASRTFVPGGSDTRRLSARVSFSTP